MRDNVYKAPNAPLVEAKDLPPFYQVSEKKFLILYISTFSLYEFYWFYKNWDQQRKVMGKKVMPIARAIFSIFFTRSLFTIIHQCLLTKKLDANWNYSIYATSIIFIAIYEWMFDKVVVNFYGETVSMVITMVSVPVSAWLFLQAQRKINLICDVYKTTNNDQLTPINFVWMIIGLCLWGLFLFSIAIDINPEIVNFLIPLND